MAWSNISKPAVGDPTTKELIDAVIDDLAFLYNQFLSVVGNREIILNGSFESDADADGFPDGWARTLYSGGSFTWDNSTAGGDGKAYHGKRSAKFTSPGGAGKGGGNITSDAFFEVSEGRSYRITWATKSSVVDVHNKAEIKFYDSTQALVSTVNFWDEATNNPTVWRPIEALVKAPANARYAKLIFYGCFDDDVTAGSTWFDDIRMNGYVPAFERRIAFTAPGVYKWKVPANVGWVAALACGGGGGGGSENGGANASGGGGAGGLAFDICSCTPGDVFTITVGSGGTASAGNNGGNGTGSAVFCAAASVDLQGNGGTGGLKDTSGGTGGAGGGTAGVGRVNSTGTAGSNRNVNVGGDGGEQPLFGAYGGGGTAGNGGNAGWYGGGGGGSGDGGGLVGGAGGAGICIICW